MCSDNKNRIIWDYFDYDVSNPLKLGLQSTDLDAVSSEDLE